jgi:N-acetyl-anhydromuramyl-L-alanine amidase AmpD
MSPRREVRYLVVHRFEVEPEAYHYTVARDGTVVARNPESQKDRSVRNFNSVAVSVAMQGCFCSGIKAKYNRPTEAQWQAVVELLATLLLRYPAATITGHSALGPGGTFVTTKLAPAMSCPGDLLRLDLLIRDAKDKACLITSSAGSPPITTSDS